MKQRRIAVGIVCVASAAMLSGCGFDAPAVTTTEHASIQAINTEAGLINVRAAFVTPPVVAGSASAAPYLVVTFVNAGRFADTFTGATTSIGTVTVSGPGTSRGQLTLLPGVPAQLSDPSINTNGALGVINTTSTTVPGTYVRMTFHFARNGDSPLVQVPVVPPGQTTAVSTPIPPYPAPTPTQVGETASD